MALKFRRGTTAQKSGSLAFGEPYVNTTLGTLQIGTDTGDVTLATQGVSSSGQFGFISGSALEISGDATIYGSLTLGGTITIGDATTDNVVVNADLSSSIIPNNDNAFDLGSAASRYRAIYANNLYGAINATNGVVSGSSQVVSILSSINSYTASNDTTNTAQSNRLTRLEESTSSLNSFSASQLTKDSTLQLYTASIDTKFSTLATYTGSNDTTNTTQNTRLTRIEESTSSLNSYTSSQTTTNTANTARFTRIEESTSSLNAYTGSQTTTNTANTARFARIEESTSSLNTYTGSTNTRLTRIEESTSSLNAFSASENTKAATLQTYTASVDTKFGAVQASTASLNTFSASALTRLSRIEESTASINLTTASLNGHVADINTWSASVKGHIADINTYTSSLKTAITVAGSDVTVAGNLTVNGTTTTVNSTTVAIGDNILELNYGGSAVRGGLLVKDATAASLSSGSFLWDGTNDIWIAGKSGSEAKVLTDGMSVVSGSAQIDATATTNWATGIKTQLNSNTVISGSSQVVGSSITTNTVTIGSTAIALGGTSTTLAGLSSVTSTGFTGALTGNASTATTLQTARTINGTSFNGSADITIANLVSGSAQISGTGITNNTITIAGQSTALGGSVTAETIRTAIGTVVTGSAQISGTGITNNTITIAGQSTALGSSVTADTIRAAIGTVVTGSAQIDATATTNWATGIKTQLNSNTVVSGSSQINYTQLSGISANIISGATDSSNIDFIITGGNLTANLFGGVVSGSAQVVGILASLNTYTGSNDTTNATQNTRLTRLEESTSSLNTFSASALTRFTRIEESTSSLNTYTSSQTTTNTANTARFTRIEESTSSLNTYTGSTNTRLTRIEESTSSLNTLTASLATTYEARASATKVLVSGSSQVNFTQLSGISANIISASTNSTNVNFTISGGSITANLIGGVVSGSIQVLGGSTVLSGSNQTYVSTINQGLGTTSTAVQFATLGVGGAPDATYEFKVTGDIGATGDIVAYVSSDERLKNNIQPIKDSLNKIEKIGGYSFEWNEELQKARKGNDLGVIAQEIKEIAPEIVTERENGYLAVDYEKIVPLLIEAIKELSAKVKELENK